MRKKPAVTRRGGRARASKHVRGPATFGGGRGSATVDIEGRTITLSNLEKPFYPKTGFTKADVIDYYARIAPVLLPYLAGRPLTLKRYPDGAEGPFFYEKRCPRYAPDWMSKARVWSGRSDDWVEYCVVEDLASLVWLANLADLELHVPLARAEAIDRPTWLVFDLDPGAPAELLDCVRVALELRALFESLDLWSCVKTSGSKGMQVYVPLNRPKTSYHDTKPFARAVAEWMERRRPKQVVSNMTKSLRVGKVLVDWSQNDEHKTTVCVYSLRARERPTVSTPVTWEEVEAADRRGTARGIVFEAADVLARVREKGDLFRPLLERKQDLPDFERS